MWVIVCVCDRWRVKVHMCLSIMCVCMCTCACMCVLFLLQWSIVCNNKYESFVCVQSCIIAHCFKAECWENVIWLFYTIFLIISCKRLEFWFLGAYLFAWQACLIFPFLHTVFLNKWYASNRNLSFEGSLKSFLVFNLFYSKLWLFLCTLICSWSSQIFLHLIQIR